MVLRRVHVAQGVRSRDQRCFGASGGVRCRSALDGSRCTPLNWTLKVLLQGLRVDSEELEPLLGDARQFFSSNPDITELRTRASKKRISAEARSLRTKHSNLFENVPADTIFDKACVTGCMKFAFGGSASHIKRETPGPPPTPALSSPSPGQKSVRAFSIPTQSLGDKVSESRLVIVFSKKDAPASSVIEFSAEFLVDIEIRQRIKAKLGYIELENGLFGVNHALSNAQARGWENEAIHFNLYIYIYMSPGTYGSSVTFQKSASPSWDS